MALLNILPFVHHTLRNTITAGATVVDATAGNGHDTVFLARCVGSTGHVFAFDIQATALAATEKRLADQDLQRQVHLIHASHEYMADYVPAGIQAAVFNFGYLPGADKSHTTQTPSSLKALQSAMSLLAAGGLITAVLYPGHPEGAREAEAITAWVATLPQQQVAVLRYGFINRVHAPPFALCLEKLPATASQ